MTCRGALVQTFNLRPKELQGCDLIQRQSLHPSYFDATKKGQRPLPSQSGPRSSRILGMWEPVASRSISEDVEGVT